MRYIWLEIAGNARRAAAKPPATRRSAGEHGSPLVVAAKPQTKHPSREKRAPPSLLKRVCERKALGEERQVARPYKCKPLHTPLTIVERHRHEYDVFPDSTRTQPFGSGATCFYNYGDLMIRNDTEQAFQIVLEVTESELIGMWKSDIQLDYRYEVYEKEHVIRSEYWGGHTRHNVLFRRKFDEYGALIDDEFVVENHAIMMYSPMLAESKEWKI